MYWILANERSDERELRIDGVPPIIENNNRVLQQLQLLALRTLFGLLLMVCITMMRFYCLMPIEIILLTILWMIYSMCWMARDILRSIENSSYPTKLVPPCMPGPTAG